MNREPSTLSPADERALADAGFVASPTRPGRWDDTRGRGRGLTTTVALRRARADLAAADPPEADATEAQAAFAFAQEPSAP